MLENEIGQVFKSILRYILLFKNKVHPNLTSVLLFPTVPQTSAGTSRCRCAARNDAPVPISWWPCSSGSATSIRHWIRWSTLTSIASSGRRSAARCSVCSARGGVARAIRWSSTCAAVVCGTTAARKACTRRATWRQSRHTIITADRATRRWTAYNRRCTWWCRKPHSDRVRSICRTANPLKKVNQPMYIRTLWPHAHTMDRTEYRTTNQTMHKQKHTPIYAVTTLSTTDKRSQPKWT